MTSSDRDTRLNLAYSLARGQRLAAAREHLDKLIAEQDSDAARLLRARVARTMGDADSARQDFAEAACRQTLSLPDVLGFSEVLLACGEADRAMKLLESVSVAGDPRWHLLMAEAYRCAGRAPEAVPHLRTVLAGSDPPAAAADRLFQLLAENPALPEGLAALESVPDRFRHSEFYWLVRGNVQHARQDLAAAISSWSNRQAGPQGWETACRFLESCLDRGGPVVAVHDAVAAALRAGNLDAAERGLALLPEDDNRTTRLAVALALQRGAVDEAAHRMEKITDDAQLAAERLAVLAACGKPPAERLLAAVDPATTAFYKALTLAAKDPIDHAESARYLEQIGLRHALRPVADRLRSWLQRRKVCTWLAAGDFTHDRPDLGSVVEDPPNALLALGATDGPPGSALLWLLAGNRERVFAVLSQAAARGKAAPGPCHNLGLFHYVEGERHAKAGDPDAAIAEWERAIGYFGITLAHFTYMGAWVEKRVAVYGANVDTEIRIGVGEKVVNQLETAWTRWAELFMNSGYKAQAERMGLLALFLRAEVRAAEKLREAGGLPLRESGGESVSGGPGYLCSRGLDHLFANWLAGLPGGTAREDLCTLYSPLRAAWFLQREGHILEALAATRRAASEHREGGATEVFQLQRANPAFARRGGSKEFEMLLATTEVTLLMEAGKREVASAEGNLGQTLEYWKAALGQTSDAGRRRVLGSRIVRTALGRTRALRRSDREKEAIPLLEAVHSLVPDERIRGELAEVLAYQAIENANEGHGLDAAIEHLKRARDYNHHSTFIDSQLSTILCERARKTFKSDRQAALADIEESIGLAEGCVHRDPHNAHFRKLAESAQAVQTGMCLVTRSGVPSDSLSPPTEEMQNGAARISPVHRNQGVEEAGRRDFAGAVDELEKAMQLEPGSATIRNELARALVAYARDLVRTGSREEARRRASRAVELDPQLAPELSAVFHDQGMAKGGRDNPAGAIEYLEVALELAPDSKETRSALVECHSAAALMMGRSGGHSRAMHHAARAAELDPSRGELKFLSLMLRAMKGAPR